MKNITYDRESVRKPLLDGEMTILSGRDFKDFMREWKKQIVEEKGKAVQAIAKYAANEETKK